MSDQIPVTANYNYIPKREQRFSFRSNDRIPPFFIRSAKADHSTSNYNERHKSLRIHTQRSACLTPYGILNINVSKGEYAIYDDAVYN